jgi:hypothetical protein
MSSTPSPPPIGSSATSASLPPSRLSWHRLIQAT